MHIYIVIYIYLYLYLYLYIYININLSLSLSFSLSLYIYMLYVYIICTPGSFSQCYFPKLGKKRRFYGKQMATNTAAQLLMISEILRSPAENGKYPIIYEVSQVVVEVQVDRT